jgi:hypothetical protein
MRPLRILLGALLAVLAIIGGLFVAAAVALGAAVVLVLRRLLRQATGSRLPMRRNAPRAVRPASGEVIEVTATEVPADPASR